MVAGEANVPVRAAGALQVCAGAVPVCVPMSQVVAELVPVLGCKPTTDTRRSETGLAPEAVPPGVRVLSRTSNEMFAGNVLSMLKTCRFAGPATGTSAGAVRSTPNVPRAFVLTQLPSASQTLRRSVFALPLFVSVRSVTLLKFVKVEDAPTAN